MRSPVIQRADWNMQERLQESYERNLGGKAEPLREREMFEVQSLSSYGYDNPKFEFAGEKGGYKKGFGGQPFLFGGVDYDQIVAAVESSKLGEKTFAAYICGVIKHGIDIGELFKAQKDQTAAKELIQLTQVIECHDSRVPGADKLARTLFAAIADGKATFRECFNRKNGLFVPAWNKTAGAICGGQEAMRAFLKLTRKKSDNLEIDAGTIKAVVGKLVGVEGYMSDDSDGGYASD